MVASKLKNYWGKVDKFGCKVSEWAEETTKNGRAKCKLCLNCEINYEKGHEPLIRHAETVKHRTFQAKLHLQEIVKYPLRRHST